MNKLDDLIKEFANQVCKLDRKYYSATNSEIMFLGKPEWEKARIDFKLGLKKLIDDVIKDKKVYTRLTTEGSAAYIHGWNHCIDKYSNNLETLFKGEE